ncbi:MAG: hypothetical protein Alpg2KO_31590 [Alphaproteobacteria bacterium]
MPDSAREAALKALTSQLAAGLSGVSVSRNDPVEEEIGAGQVTVWDGDPGQPVQSFSPPLWHWEHEALLEVLVEGLDPDPRSAALDALLQQVGAAIEADPTLNGTVEFAQVAGLAPTDHELIPGGVEIAGMPVIVLLHYTSSSPLG